jgi:hypothetical protein
MAVAGLFMATDRASAGAFAGLASDAVALGYEVEWDGELPGGDDWWRGVLAKVEHADAFIYVLTATSIASNPCQEQLRYAIALGRPVLPVLLGDGISDVDLPPSLGQLQRVDYRSRSSTAMAQLFSALRGLQLQPPRLQPPLAPQCPMEFSLDLVARLQGAGDLSRHDQDVILEQVGHYVRSGYSAAEVAAVLELLRARRPDMTVANTRRLDELEAALNRAMAPPSLPGPAGGRVIDGHPPVQRVFMSYSRAERETVNRLVRDIELLGFDVWIDQNLPGGKPWWDQLLTKIVDADALVFAAGPASLASRACKAELEYARGLGTQVLRVDLDPKADGRSDPEWKGTVEVTYVPGDKASLAALAQALRRLSRIEPPAELPAPPEVPATYLFDVQNQLRSPAELDAAAQSEVLVQIGRYADEGVPHADLAKLLVLLEARDDTTNRTAENIAALRAKLDIASSPTNQGMSPPTSTSTAPGAMPAQAVVDSGAAAQGRPPAIPPNDVPPPVPPADVPPAGVPPVPAPAAPVDQLQRQRARRRGALVAAAVAVVALAGIGGAVALTAGGDDEGGADPTIPPTPSPVVTTIPDVTLSPTTPPPTEPPTVPPTAAPPFTGVTGALHVQWTSLGITYFANVRMAGPGGSADVRWLDPLLGDVTMREDLTLRQAADGEYYYVGSALRVLPSEAPAPTGYEADVYHLVEQGSDRWTISDVCYSQGCSPAISSAP